LPTLSPDALRKAVEARTEALARCPLPPGAPPRLPTRLRVSRAGRVEAVSCHSLQPLPAELADCLQQTMKGWLFTDVDVVRDVELFLTFDLGA
jgi:hypothetical protein